MSGEQETRNILKGISSLKEVDEWIWTKKKKDLRRRLQYVRRVMNFV